MGGGFLGAYIRLCQAQAWPKRDARNGCMETGGVAKRPNNGGYGGCARAGRPRLGCARCGEPGIRSGQAQRRGRWCEGLPSALGRPGTVPGLSTHTCRNWETDVHADTLRHTRGPRRRAADGGDRATEGDLPHRGPRPQQAAMCSLPLATTPNCNPLPASLPWSPPSPAVSGLSRSGRDTTWRVACAGRIDMVIISWATD